MRTFFLCNHSAIIASKKPTYNFLIKATILSIFKIPQLHNILNFFKKII